MSSHMCVVMRVELEALRPHPLTRVVIMTKFHENYVNKFTSVELESIVLKWLVRQTETRIVWKVNTVLEKSIRMF